MQEHGVKQCEGRNTAVMPRWTQPTGELISTSGIGIYLFEEMLRDLQVSGEVVTQDFSKCPANGTEKMFIPIIPIA